nr:integrase, catalytic region, zinc finger, CCHC-type, peptidase aspartic, catalytic [Tanacetum cinerariifolium]
MQAHLQGKDNAIRQLKKQLSKLQVTSSDTEQLYDSIKITRAKHIEQVTKLTAENVTLKTSVSKAKVQPPVLTRTKHAVDVEPIVPRLRKNRDAHLDYLRHLKESVKTIRDIVEEAKVVRPLDRSIVSACRVTSYPKASGSQPKSNPKTNRISPAKGANKLPLEDLPRTNKSHLRTTNRVDSSSRIKRTQVWKPKHVERKMKQVWKPKQVGKVWKPTGKVITTIGHQWRPTSRILHLGKQYPLTRFTPPQVVSTAQNKKQASRTDRPVVFGFTLLKTYDGGSLTALEFRKKVHQDSSIREFGAIMGYGDYVVGESVISRGSRESNLYTISVEDMMKSSPICLLYKASKNKSWLWHQHLNHLNFGTINDLARKDLVRGLPRLKFEKDHLCSACQLGKSKKHTHKPKAENTNLDVLSTLHMDLCGPMRVQTINGKKYILVIVDDYSRFTWVKFLRSKDETPDVVIKFITQIQVEAVATACYTQNRFLIHTRHHKTPYELVHNKKPDLTFFRVFDALCYPTNDIEDLGKLQPTSDTRIFIGYAPSKKGYRIYNKRTRRIMETIHVQFDELTEPMAPVHLSTGPASNFLTPGQISSCLVPNLVPATPYVPLTNKELEILFQPIFDEYLEPPRAERPGSPAQAVQALVTSAGTPLSTTIDQDAPSPHISPSSSALQSHSLPPGVVAEPHF